MLVLSRKRNESLMIDDKIRIVVVEIRGDKVRLGIEAPQHVAVHRLEVYEAIHRDRDAATDVLRAASAPGAAAAQPYLPAPNS